MKKLSPILPQTKPSGSLVKKTTSLIEVEEVKALGRLCLRIESALNKLTSDPQSPASVPLPITSISHLEVPISATATDAELSSLLEHYTNRIDNALRSFAMHQLVSGLNKSTFDGSLDAFNALSQLQALLGLTGLSNPTPIPLDPIETSSRSRFITTIIEDQSCSEAEPDNVDDEETEDEESVEDE